MRAVIPYMLKQGGGAIVNVSGRGGRQPTPAHLPGSCANIAVNTLTKGLADIYGPRNIRINAVAPGPIDTARHHAIAQSNTDLKKADAKRNPPLGRLGRPEEVAAGRPVSCILPRELHHRRRAAGRRRRHGHDMNMDTPCVKESHR